MSDATAHDCATRRERVGYYRTLILTAREVTSVCLLLQISDVCDMRRPTEIEFVRLHVFEDGRYTCIVDVHVYLSLIHI